MVNTGILTLSGGNGEETKWKIVIHIYKVNLESFSHGFVCVQGDEIKEDSRGFYLNRELKSEKIKMTRRKAFFRVGAY